MKLIDTSYVVPVSVTGNFCPMNCKHCRGIYLKHMVRVEEMESFARSGRKVFLISGGMLPNGEIPFKPHEEVLRDLKERFSLLYNFHIGFPKKKPEVVERLADVVSADFYADSEVLKEVYGIRRDPDEILDVMLSFETPVVPHITIGALCGKLTHEYDALDVLSKHFRSVVLNVFVPTPLTAYENCPPPSVDDVVELFMYARERFERVILGCMQPRGSYRKRLQSRLGFVYAITKPVLEGERTHNCCAFEAIW